VPFELVPELVRGRRVYLRRGVAFVHRDALASLVVGAFRASLSRALALTARRWAARFAGEEAERCAPVVDALATRYLGVDYGARSADGGAGVSLADLDAAAAQSFPLCMRNLYGHLKEAHHLRHAGRMQLGLFLKGIGLRLEDAMVFWRAEFCKKIAADAFEKQYAYAIRHNYGREGKRADYTPYSCMKVIMSTPGTGEHHGCPYRTFSEDSLRAALRGMKLASGAVAEVLDKVRGKHYQLACGAAFAGAHAGCGGACDAGIQHPNQYFQESRKQLGLDKPAAAAAGAGGEPVSPGGAAPPGLTTPAPERKTSSGAGSTPPSARAM
jgi:DNA primase large subunit